jgi:hypothetical protein
MWFGGALLHASTQHHPAFWSDCPEQHVSLIDIESLAVLNIRITAQ